MQHSNPSRVTKTFTDVDDPSSGDRISAALAYDGTVEFLTIDTYNANGKPAFVSMTKEDAVIFAADIIKLTA